MSVSIVPCPSCQTPLLSDTVQCPNCDHVLKPEQFVEIPEVRLHSDTDQSSDDIRCPDCGETVRKELVRCWQCGAFLKPQIAETYQKMQEQAPSESPELLPETDDIPLADEEPLVANAGQADADNAGFELAPGLGELSAAATAPDADPAEVPPLGDVSTQAVSSTETDADTAPDATDAGAGGYTLQTTATPPAEAPVSQPSSESEASDSSAAVLAPEPEAGDVTAAEGTTEPTPSPSDTESATAPSAEESDSQVAHSVATGGDVLLDIAMKEEKEAEQRRRSRGKPKSGKRGSTRQGFVIFCPNGHQIEVQDRHRGMTGRCPKCKGLFHVPRAGWQDKKSTADETGEAAKQETEPAAQAEQVSQYAFWLTDVHIHRVDAKKLKLKPGSLESAFEAVDMGFSNESVLLVSLVKNAGLKGSAKKKIPETRQAMLEHLAEGKPIDEIPAAWQMVVDVESAKQIAVVQPALYAHESMFAAVPVFGQGRIAIRLPQLSQTAEMLFASFALSEFRQLAQQMDELLGVKDLGEDCGVPLTDSVVELKCHYTDETLRSLEKVEFYQVDPSFPLKLIGRQCQECELVVSEDARKKEKIGGSSGKGIAKARCPKCKKKFGSITLYGLEQEPPESTSESESE